MRLFGFLGKKKKSQISEQYEKGSRTQSTGSPYSDSANKTAHSNPYAYDSALFRQFHDDLENNALPEIPDPTQVEIREYSRKKNMLLTKDGPLSDSVDMNLLMENYRIPVEVDIWVDKVFSHYFDNLMPMMGLVHRCEGAKKALYKYKGYTWHTVSELYPTVIFD